MSVIITVNLLTGFHVPHELSSFLQTRMFKKRGFSSTTAGDIGTANESYLNNISKASSYSKQDSCNYFYLDDDFTHLPQNSSSMDDLSYLQAQFEAADIPTGIEASIPWWLEPGQSNSQPVNFSSPSNSDFNSAQPILASVRNQLTRFHDNRSVEGPCSSLGFSYSNSNGSISVSHNHGSLPEKNHASYSSFAAASQEVSRRTETSSTNTVHEDAIKRIQQFENFAIVDDFSDHHYTKNLFSTQVSTKCFFIY